MKLLGFLFGSNVYKSLVIAGLSVLSGIGSAALIATVNATLEMRAAPKHSMALMALALTAALVAKVGGSLISNLILGRLAQESILNLCTNLCLKIAATPFRKFEEIGSARMLTCLTEDVNVLSVAIQAIPLIVINTVVLAGCSAYLAWISWTAVLVLTLVMGLTAFCYRIFITKAYPAVRSARLGKETLFRHFRCLTDGIKELKVHRQRREAFFREELVSAGEYYRRQNIIAMNRYAVADGWSQMMFGVLLATLLFMLPAISRVTQHELVKFVFVAIYLMSPAWNLTRSLPTFASGQASLDRMQELGLTLEGLARTTIGGGDSADKVDSLQTGPSKPPLIEFRNVKFSYADNERGGFTVGPIDFALHPSELTFVIGGNGSGKSSIVKLLTGLYTPDSGEILVDGKPVSAEGQEDYRQLFSVVYSDFYLFERLLGISGLDLEANAEGYLAALGLSDKVSIKGNSFSTTDVSQGQRRRLALLSAYMEDRPIYVLDEWAADQDPAFRQVFYLKLLPELKRRGKTVVVVTHDDRYFHLGDRIIKLDCGKVVETMQPAIST